MRKALTGIVMLALGAALAPASQAQDIKLYAFSSGALTIGKGILQNLAPVDPPIQVPVGFFVVMHPKGNLLFDTGNNDKIINDPSYWGPFAQALQVVRTPDVAIDTQLPGIGQRRQYDVRTGALVSWDVQTPGSGIAIHVELQGTR